MSTRCSVGVYSPVGVDNAMLMSVCGRRVRVGLSEGEEDEVGVMDERKSGQSSIAFESVFKRIGRCVSFVNCAEISEAASVGCG